MKEGNSMIKTKQKPLKKKPLKLLNIKFDNFIDNNLSVLEDYINNNLIPSWYTLHAGAVAGLKWYGVLAIDRKSKLHIINYQNIPYADDLFGANDKINLLRRDLSIKNWATAILKHYVSWLKKQLQKQQSLTPQSAFKLLNRTTHGFYALFTAEAYNNWIFSQLEDLTADEFEVHFASSYDFYFYDKLLVALNNCQQIHVSLLKHILASSMKSIYHRTQWQTILNKGYDIIFNPNSKIKLINDDTFYYPSLIYQMSLTASGHKDYVLPLWAIFQFVDSELLDELPPLKVKYILPDKKMFTICLQRLMTYLVKHKKKKLEQTFEKLGAPHFKLDVAYRKILIDYFDMAGETFGAEYPQPLIAFQKICNDKLFATSLI